MPPDDGLVRLREQVAQDLEYMDFPARAWVPPRFLPSGQRVLDVVVVGAGLNGLAITFGLLRERVINVVAIDRAPRRREGPWLTFARMPGLRTPKTLVGPDLGLRSLSFPAWFEATHGRAGWEALVRATNEEWMDYLEWFRDTADLPVMNGVELLGIRPQGDVVALEVSREGVAEVWAARKVVLATGVLGSGGPYIPPFVAEALPRKLYAHSAEKIDFARLRGKRVAVLGAGASAFDNAAVALESGAGSVKLFARRAEVEQPSAKAGLEISGFLRFCGDLDDAARWRIMRRLAMLSVPPPPDTIERCRRHPSFEVFTSCPWTGAGFDGSEIAIETKMGRFAVDFVILGTGFDVDLKRRPEVALIEGDIARWSDMYTPPAELAFPRLGESPYLGGGFEYVARPGRAAPYLRNIHDFGIASVQSMGPVTTGLNGMKFGPTRLVRAVAQHLFLEDAAVHEANFVANRLPQDGTEAVVI
jgi:cation diffusion facilitator CzcD-associated flavoprotein CzcO